MNPEVIDNILTRHRWKRTHIIAILQDLQQEFNHLPKEGLIHIADKLGVPLSQLYSLATFYRAFTLEPRGKHLIQVCLGTACHVRGAMRVLESIERATKIKPGETTKDKKFTLETVNCLGCCAIGPIVVIDDQYYGEMTSTQISSILKRYND